jgi:eukaryotic-like serine/threonine-protein kinase
VSAVAATADSDDAVLTPPAESGEEIVPGYEVVEHMSRGHALDVYDVHSEERDCRCVVKAIRPDRVHQPGPRCRLVREGEVLAALTHPHFVRAYELVREPSPALVLEALGGETLDHLLYGRSRRLPAAELAHLGLHLCSAIRYLHRHGWLHLDLKPSNVVCDAGLAKVIDLSVARAPGRGPAGVGTAHYMAPEQASGGVLTVAADAWGLGAVLFEGATGERPFRDEEHGRYEQLERRAEPVAARRRLPARLGRAIDSCLDPLPERRPSVAALAEGLRPFVG